MSIRQYWAIMNKFLHVTLCRVIVQQNKCFWVLHIKKPWTNIYIWSYSKDKGTFQGYNIGEDHAACCVLFGITTGRSHIKNQIPVKTFNVWWVLSSCKPPTTSYTRKYCWVFSLWFQSHDSVHWCCRQSKVVLQISFTLAGSSTAVSRKPHFNFLHTFTF